MHTLPDVSPHLQSNSAIYSNRWNQGQLSSVRDVWHVLATEFFQRMIAPHDRVLDIGCGFFHFLNSIQAGERVGVDANENVKAHAAPGVTFVHTCDLRLPQLPERHYDFIFISNFLEHLSGPDDVLLLLKRTRQLLSPGGRLVILQPNFRLLGWRYFDFIDHKTILTDANVREALEVCGFELRSTILRFLPYTTKSRIPRHPWLVRAYLRLPLLWRVLGKQSLFVASPV